MRTLRKLLTSSSVLPLMLLLAMGSAVLAQAPSKKDIKKSNDLVQQGNKAFNSRNYKSAIEKYAQALVLVPRNAAAHFWKGNAHYRLKDYSAALTELNLAEEQGHPAVDVSKVRWFVNFELKNFDAALADVDRGLQADPNDQAMLRASGDLNFEKKNYQVALASYQKAVAGSPNDGNLYYAMALSNQALGDADAQFNAASVAVTKPTQYISESYYLLADAAHKKKNYDVAIDAYNRVLSAKPETLGVYRALGDVYRAENRFTDAIEIIKRGLRLWPNDGNLYTDISWYYSLAEQHQNAVDAAQAAVKLLPNVHLGYTNLCRAYNDLKQTQFAINACNGALKINPNDGETYFYLGRAYREQGKTAEATRAFDRAVVGLLKFTAENSDYSDGFYLLGNAYFADDQPEKALAAYKKCLDLSPRFTRARYNTGIIQIRLNNKSAAMEQYNALLGLDQSLATRLKIEIDKM